MAKLPIRVHNEFPDNCTYVYTQKHDIEDWGPKKRDQYNWKWLVILLSNLASPCSSCHRKYLTRAYIVNEKGQKKKNKPSSHWLHTTPKKLAHHPRSLYTCRHTHLHAHAIVPCWVHCRDLLRRTWGGLLSPRPASPLPIYEDFCWEIAVVILWGGAGTGDFVWGPRLQVPLARKDKSCTVAICQKYK